MAVKSRKAAKRKAPGRKAARKKSPKRKVSRKKAARRKVPAKKSSRKKAAKKKSAKKKVTRKKAPAKKASRTKAAKRKTARKQAVKKTAVKKKATARKSSSGKAASKAVQERRAAAARAEAARRAAAVKEQLSRARLGTFEDLFENAEPEVRTIGYQLRNLVMELVPTARETVYLRWKIALYKTSTEICGIQPAVDRCNFYLTKGAYLHDPQGILEGSGKAIRHVKVRSVVGMAAEGLRDLIKQSLEITAV